MLNALAKGLHGFPGEKTEVVHWDLCVTATVPAMEKISSATGPLYHALECGIVSEVRQALEMGQLDVNTLFQARVDAVTFP